MRKLSLAMIYGVITIFVVIILASLLLSLLLRFTSMQESSLSWVVIAVSFLAMFVGGFVTGGKGKEKGWLIGSGSGLLFSIIVFLFQYLGHDSLFSTQQSIYHLGFLATAAIGGIFGVNMTTPSRTQS